MPKDKAVTNAKIIEYMKEEFLTYGYEKASLNRISAKVGITTAGLYKHFKGKEDMFYYLVKDALDAFHELTDSNVEQMEMEISYNPFADDWAKIWVDFIYKHHNGIKLLICCAEGSPYESFEEQLIEFEAAEDKRYAEIQRASGKKNREISDVQWHMLATAYTHLVLEIVRHDMSRKEALEHMRFVGDLLYPGWKNIYGIDN